MHYVYTWSRPDGQVFYVGLGKGDRCYVPGRNSHVDRICAKLEREGTPHVVAKVFQGTRQQCCTEEVRLIAELGRTHLGTGPLANKTAGGDGVHDIPRDVWEAAMRKLSQTNMGHPVTSETRAKIAATLKGRKHEPERVEKMRQALIGRSIPPEQAARISKTLKGRTLSEEHKRKIGEANRGKKRTAEQREKIAQAREGRAVSDKQREALLRYSRGPRSEKHKQALREAALRRKDRS